MPGSGVSGVIRLTQTAGGIRPTVTIEAGFIGLEPGARHGFHIHERGDCSNTNPATGATGNFLGARGHYDPGPKSDSNPDNNHPFHMGDMPNVEVNELRVGYLRHTTSRVTLSWVSLKSPERTRAALCEIDPRQPKTQLASAFESDTCSDAEAGGTLTESTVAFQVNRARMIAGRAI